MPGRDPAGSIGPILIGGWLAPAIGGFISRPSDLARYPASIFAWSSPSLGAVLLFAYRRMRAPASSAARLLDCGGALTVSCRPRALSVVRVNNRI